jgi:hypothetical protein
VILGGDFGGWFFFGGGGTVGPIGQKALNKVSSHPHRIYLTEWTFISWMGLKLTLKQILQT